VIYGNGKKEKKREGNVNIILLFVFTVPQYPSVCKQSLEVASSRKRRVKELLHQSQIVLCGSLMLP
jgi:hypothetical protein